MIIECTALFDFNTENGIEREVCESLGLAIGTMTEDLDETQYNEVCDAYNVPRLDEEFNVEIDDDCNDESIICNTISNCYGWLVTSFYYEESKDNDK